MITTLARRQVLIVTGKGGVGKSVVAATVGRALARSGRQVLLLETDPRESLFQLLGVQPSGGEVVPVEPKLRLQNLRPRQVLDGLVRERLRLELLARRVLSSSVYHHFAEGAPGLKEMALLGHAFRTVGGQRRRPAEADVVVLDAPATGHGLSLLTAPQLVAEVIREGPFGRLASELAAFVGDGRRCGVVVVTLAEEMPVQECLELREGLRSRLDREPDLLVVNRLYPPFPAGAPGGDVAAELWRQRRNVQERELRRLVTAWPGPRVELPFLPVERGPGLVAALGRGLDGGRAA